MDDRVELPDNQAEAAAPAAPRALLASVYIMGVILVLLFVAVIAGIVWKVSAKKEEVTAAIPELNLGLPAGTLIQSVAVDGDRLVVTAGGEIIVIDLRKTAVSSRITVAPK